MPPKTLKEAHSDPAWWEPFKAWSQSTYGYDFMDEWDLFNLVRLFRVDPCASSASMVVRNFIGIPGKDWTTFAQLSVDIPLEMRQATIDLVTMNYPDDPDDDLPGDTVVPITAFNDVEEFVNDYCQPTWEAFLAQADGAGDAAPTYDENMFDWNAIYAKNHSNTGGAGEGEQLSWRQAGYAVLIGDGHSQQVLEFVASQPNAATGTLIVEHGGGLRYPRGRLRVVGCTEQDEFKWAVSQTSKKHVSFRDS